MKHILLSAFALNVVVVFSAYGGNGNGRVNPNLDSTPDVSRLTPSDVQDRVNQVSAAANSLLMTDLVVTSRSAVHANARGITRCGGTICESEPAYEEPYWSLNELAALFSDASLRIDAPRYGVHNGVLSGQTSSVEFDEGRNFTTDYTVYDGWMDQNFFGLSKRAIKGEASMAASRG